MKTIKYSDKNFDVITWNFIDQNEEIKILIPQKLSMKIEKALKAYAGYHDDKKKKNIKNWGLLFNFARFGMSSPSLWGVINHAEMNGFYLSHWEFNDEMELGIYLLHSSQKRH